MSTEINLLPQKTKSRISQEQLLAYTKIGALVVCILTASFAIMLFLLNRDTTLTQIQSQQQTVLAQLNLLHNKTAKNLIIADRVARIKKILSSRKALEKDIADIQEQLPGGISVNTFTLDDKKLSITVSGASLAPMGAFIESLTNDVQNKKIIQKFTIEGIISDEKTGDYLLSITGDLL